jgi:hypothetical protein
MQRKISAHVCTHTHCLFSSYVLISETQRWGCFCTTACREWSWRAHFIPGRLRASLRLSASCLFSLSSPLDCFPQFWTTGWKNHPTRTIDPKSFSIQDPQTPPDLSGLCCHGYRTSLMQGELSSAPPNSYWLGFTRKWSSGMLWNE